MSRFFYAPLLFVLVFGVGHRCWASMPVPLGLGIKRDSSENIKAQPAVEKVIVEEVKNNKDNNKDTKEPTESQICDALKRYKDKQEKQKTPEKNDSKLQPRDGPNKGKKEVFLASTESQKVDVNDETIKKADKKVADMKDSERDELNKKCPDTTVDMGNVDQNIGTEGNTAPAESGSGPTVSGMDTPFSAPTSDNYAAGAGGNNEMGAMFQQMLQQQMQQQLMQKLSGQGSGAESNTACPTGTTLTPVNGINACVGKAQTTAANCVQLNGKSYCRENDCSGEGREIIRVNSLTYCTGGSAGDVAVGGSVVERDGYADGNANQNGVCGKQIAEKYTNNQEYLAAFARGVNDCRSGVSKPTAPVSSVLGNIDDATVRIRCVNQVIATANAINLESRPIPSCLLDMAFRPQGDLNNPNQCIAGEGTKEMDVFGYDKTRQNLLITAKTQFDAGKIDALNGKTLNDVSSTLPEAYRQGFECGKMI